MRRWRENKDPISRDNDTLLLFLIYNRGPCMITETNQLDVNPLQMRSALHISKGKINTLTRVLWKLFFGIDYCETKPK